MPGRLRIGFFTDGPPFDGGSPERQALGGSETALVQAARSLARQGHRVMVFNNCKAPGVFDQVTYQPARSFPIYSANPGFDVFIVSRFYEFFRLPFSAGLKVLWNHDTLDRPSGLRAVLDRIDLLLVLSRYHRDNYLTRLAGADQKLFVTRNAVDLSLIDQCVMETQKKPNRVIYASRPERGLHVLLESIWPRIKAVRPDLKLALCGYEVAKADLAPGLAELYRHIDSLIDQSPDVTVLGSLPKREYYRQLAGSALMLYPCTFPEISCIAAIEAQACGTPIITTRGFALNETVKPDAYKISGRPGTEEYDRAFAETALNFLDDPKFSKIESDKARKAVEKQYTWDAVTTEWVRVFRLALKSKGYPDGIDEAVQNVGHA